MELQYLYVSQQQFFQQLMGNISRSYLYAKLKSGIENVKVCKMCGTGDPILCDMYSVIHFGNIYI